ncbi:MAG: hypothetical protein A2Y62_06630 [Candidatus Fischerbacteria bacterium RBG_13_37_8]|uniref:tetrahydrofolate synthase n=1 Tax=Candidatus Fischerbacteria bacterium RBG_13_37_8 TaxID=1817863 RepID=A0A1F5VJJ1_9BACT|nr:MAG: hypothetical protein A2Y62_06630 [Candidatus Fischerbacteria bacterium RBG_13_37_8]
MNSSRIIRLAHTIQLNETAILNNAYHYLDSLNAFGIKLELNRIDTICKLLDNPQKSYPSVIIGGTNGKGSVSAFLAAILQESGLKVGLFTSPHLVSAVERIQINRIPIKPFRLAQLIHEQKKLDGQHTVNLTYFECMTALSFQYFKDEKIDFGIFEVGLGGTYDATNILEPLLSCVTHIHYDHTNYLGTTLPSIAREKAGIIKHNGCFIHMERRPSLKKIFARMCAAKDSLCINALQGTKVFLKFEYPYYRASFVTPHHHYQPVRIPLLGRHQVFNALLAVRIAEELINRGLKIPFSAIEAGIEHTKWEGRLEMVSRKPLIFIDSAHNLEGIQTAFETMLLLKKQKLIVLFGVLKDKLWRKMLKIIDVHADYIIFSEPVSERALSAEEFARVSIKTAHEIIPDPSKAYARALEKADDDSIILVIGSTYLAGHIKNSVFSEGTAYLKHMLLTKKNISINL